MQPPHHDLELLHGALGRRGVPHIRGEAGQRVVAPVVRQPGTGQPPLADGLVHRQQLDGGHSQVGEVAERSVRAQSQVRSAEVRRDIRVARGEALDMDLVEDRLVPWNPRVPVASPREGRVHHRGEGGERRAVPRVRGQIARGVVEGIPVDRVAPAQGAADAFRVGIENHLLRVEAVTRRRVVRSAHAIAVRLPRPDVGQVAVPHEIGPFRERDARRLPRRLRAVEEAQLHLVGMLREDREVDAGPIPGRPERVRLAGPDLHGTLDDSARSGRKCHRFTRRRRQGAGIPQVAVADREHRRCGIRLPVVAADHRHH